MAEIKDAPPAEEVKTPGKIVERGKPTIGNPVTQIEIKEPDAGAGGATETADEKTAREAKEFLLKNETPEQKTARELSEKNKPPELNEEQFKELLKSKGIELDDKGIEGLKEKLKPAASAKSPEEIEKEKVAAESALDKRMLDYFIEKGGKAENYVALQQIASADLRQLSVSAITKEMKEGGFEDDEIVAILKERYYQINPEELVRDEENETEEAFNKRKAATEKKIAFGVKKIDSKGSFIKKQATDALGVIRQAIEQQDADKQEEATISSKADEVALKLPRKLTFDLGFLDDAKSKKIDPIDYVVQQSDIDEVSTTFKEVEKRKQFLYNQDGSLNLENLMQVMLRNKILESGLKTSYIEGSNNRIAEFEKTFPGRTPQDIGVGGAAGGGATGRKGVIASRGKPQAASQTYK